MSMEGDLVKNEADKPEIFEIKATRCKRCGGILLSKFGLTNGMGHVCKRKADEEAAAAAIRKPAYALFASGR